MVCTFFDFFTGILPPDGIVVFYLCVALMRPVAMNNQRLAKIKKAQSVLF
jgi:hypothetical protein